VLEEGLGLEAEKILSLSFGWEQTPRLLCTSSVCYGKFVVKPGLASPIQLGLSSSRKFGRLSHGVRRVAS